MRWITAILMAAAACSAGAQWQMQESHTTADLRGIANVGKGIAWASGTHGTVLRTLDQGKTWQTCAVPPDAEKLDFRGVQAFDAKTAIVMSSGPGDASRLYKTVDGCGTWKLVFTNPDKDGFWDALKIPEPSSHSSFPISGTVIGDPVKGHFPIFITSDSGDTWHRWGVPGHGLDRKSCGEEEPLASTGEALFAASNQSLLFDLGSSSIVFVTGGEKSRLFISDHIGADAPPCWTRFQTEDLKFSASAASGAFAVASDSDSVDDLTKLVIVGGDYQHPETPAHAFSIQLKTSHWLWQKRTQAPRLSQTQPHGYRSAVAYDALLKTWITVGPNGTDISTDESRNWHAITRGAQDTPDSDKNWNALSLPFVVGPKGRIGILRNSAIADGHKQ